MYHSLCKLNLSPYGKCEIDITNLVTLFCTFSFSLWSLINCGAQVVQQYSSMGRTRALYRIIMYVSTIYYNIIILIELKTRENSCLSY